MGDDCGYGHLVPEITEVAPPTGANVGATGVATGAAIRGATKAIRKPLSPRAFVIVVATCMGVSALSIDLGLPAFADIRSEFGLSADSTRVSAVITMYFLGLAGGQLFFGPMSDKFGRKPALTLGFTVFVIGAIGASLMTTLGGVLAFRVLWGVGAAAPRVVAMAMVRDTQQGNQMARTMSLAMAIFLIVPVIAPSLGEVLLTFSPWRIVFLVPGAVGLLVLTWIVRRLPETLPPDKRRSVSPRALADAMGQVLRTRQTAALGLAVAFLFGAMISFVGSSELIIDDVFGRPEIFAVMFGVVGILLGAGALLNAHLVVRIGIERMLRVGSIYIVVMAAVAVAVSRIDGGVPPLWLFWTSISLLMPGLSMMVPNCNTAAMVPLPHVAGMASAALGAVSTAGGALLGSIADASFDGTVRPFALHILVYVILGVFSINVLALGRRRGKEAPVAT